MEKREKCGTRRGVTREGGEGKVRKGFSYFLPANTVSIEGCPGKGADKEKGPKQ